jgi:hypothetical protein
VRDLDAILHTTMRPLPLSVFSALTRSLLLVWVVPAFLHSPPGPSMISIWPGRLPCPHARATSSAAWSPGGPFVNQASRCTTLTCDVLANEHRQPRRDGQLRGDVAARATAAPTDAKPWWKSHAELWEEITDDAHFQRVVNDSNYDIVLVGAQPLSVRMHTEHAPRNCTFSSME